MTHNDIPFHRFTLEEKFSEGFIKTLMILEEIIICNIIYHIKGCIYNHTSEGCHSLSKASSSSCIGLSRAWLICCTASFALCNCGCIILLVDITLDLKNTFSFAPAALACSIPRGVRPYREIDWKYSPCLMSSMLLSDVIPAASFLSQFGSQ